MTDTLTGLAAIAVRHGSAQGHPSAVSGLTIWTATAPTEPTPSLFEPQFYLLLQGVKRTVIGGETLKVSAGTCAVGTVGLPFVSEVLSASLSEPYIGLGFKLDQRMIADLLPAVPQGVEPCTGAISFAEVEEAVVEPLGRLLRLLDTPGEIPVLAQAYERELCFRLLQGPLGPRLRQLGSQTTRFGQIRRAVDWIARHADQPMSVEWLASHVGMSVTSFHRHFRAITSHTPLAYRQHIRLLDARRRLASGSSSVTEAAFATGYASASQFSREYRRAFGIAPIHEVRASPSPVAV